MRRAASRFSALLLGLVPVGMGSGCGKDEDEPSLMLGGNGEGGAGAGGTRSEGEAGVASGSGGNPDAASAEGGVGACPPGCVDGGGEGGGDAGLGGVQPIGGVGGDAVGAGGVSASPTAGTSGADSAGAAGEAGAGNTIGGSGPIEPELVNGCSSFIDETDANALRTIDWGVTVALNPARCQRVLPGQTVRWLGSFDSHPIQPSGGTLPTPITGDAPAAATTYSVTFPEVGVYGYECGLHAGMRGAIEVR